jgi:hypothetical protein
MNKKISDIFELHSCETDFQSNLEKLIKKINKILIEDLNKPKKIFLKYKSEDYFEFNYSESSEEYEDRDENSHESNLFKQILRKTIKNKLKVIPFISKWSDGREDNNIAMLRYHISYTLDEYEISFKYEIHNEMDKKDKIVVYESVEICGIIKYITLNHSNSFGIKYDRNERGIIYCKPQEAEYFYNRYNENNVFKSINSFYENFIQILLSSMVYELKFNYCSGCYDDDRTNVSINKCELIPDAIDNSYVLK